MVQTLKEIINYVNSVKGYTKSSFNADSTINLYDIFIQEWGEHYFEIISKFQSKYNNWHSISCNPNITMEIIEKYPDKLKIVQVKDF